MTDDKYQYYCKDCGYCRNELLPVAYGIGGFAWSCPRCNNSNVASYLKDNKYKKTVVINE